MRELFKADHLPNTFKVIILKASYIVNTQRFKICFRLDLVQNPWYFKAPCEYPVAIIMSLIPICFASGFPPVWKRGENGSRIARLNIFPKV
ncbi:MAG: hypothetical protein EA360_05505 [Balneolaceae bacterium]|nr:MAG: hypothetical protein EA360_05505 [Balneolaceae bacterium]